MVISTALTAFLIALSCNLDNVGVGISYGTRRIRLPLATNLYIAFLTAAGTYLAMVLGQQVFRFFSPASGALLGGGILVAMGVWVMAQEMGRRRQPVKTQEKENEPGSGTTPRSGWRHLLEILEEPLRVDYDKSGHIDLKEGTILGLALLLNNLPNGVAAAMIKLPALLTTLTVGILSLLTFWLGISIGRYVGDRSAGNTWAWVASGTILIGIGVVEIVLALPWRI
jgi:putative sporulation protein YtaF